MHKIIVIENDPDTLDILRYIFEGRGFAVLSRVASVPLDTIITENPDLILLDYYLDDEYGSDYCQELKHNPLTSHIPIILLSTTIELHQIVTESCANAYLKKPFELGELEVLVNGLLANNGSSADILI